MSGKSRWITLTILFTLLISFIILSASFPNLEFKPGQPFSLKQEFLLPTGKSQAQPFLEIMMVIFRALLAIGIILLPAYLVYLIISPAARKRLFRDLIIITTYLLLFFFLSQSLKNITTGITSQNRPEQFQNEDVPVSQFNTTPPQWLILTADLLLGMLLFAATGIILRFLWKKSRPKAEPLHQIAEQAQIGLEAIREGRELKDIIIRCYIEMCRILFTEQGIYRSDIMTPREFERSLSDKGLPLSAIHQLTLLFEDVRYGDKIPGSNEKQQATESLSAIVQACRKTA